MIKEILLASLFYGGINAGDSMSTAQAMRRGACEGNFLVPPTTFGRNAFLTGETAALVWNHNRLVKTGHRKRAILIGASFAVLKAAIIAHNLGVKR